MATQTQSSSPFSRLSRLALPFKSSASSPLSPGVDADGEDWYIPYNGPYEPPKAERNTDSWGHLVSGWLAENDDVGRGQRARAASNASRTTGDSLRGKSPRMLIKLDQAGGVGDVPTPARPPRRSQDHAPAPAHHRASFASILSFGRQRGASPGAHPSFSTGELRNEPVPPVPQNAREREGERQQQQLEASNSQLAAFPRRHPYAVAIPSLPAPSPVVSPPPVKSASKFSVQLLDPLARKPTAPAYLLPERRPSKLSLKASMSTPNLRAATGTGFVLPKGKQRWLSAETWCDALILPRPRFALRIVEGESSGRIVSPPASPIWPPGVDPLAAPAAKTSPTKGKSLKKSQSAVQLRQRPEPPSPPVALPRTAVESSQPQAGPSTIRQAANGVVSTDASLKPYRPKSWALDDLALPSPVPSLAK